MKEMFIFTRFNRKSHLMIQAANEIIEEHMKSGLVLTLRQLYYQFVARDLIPNKQSEYKNLGNLNSRGRLSGIHRLGCHRGPYQSVGSEPALGFPG